MKADTSLRSIHLVSGGATLLAFLITGAYMRQHDPPLASMEWGMRLLYRSRHIYILAAAVANLLLGAYVQPLPDGAMHRRQWAGSGLVILSALLLVIAFVVEPALGRDPSAVSAYGLFSLLAGTLLHVQAGLRGRKRHPSAS